jgi:hypothetical protein
MPRARTEKYEIEVERPRGVTTSQMRKHIRESVEKYEMLNSPHDFGLLATVRVVWVTKINKVRSMRMLKEINKMQKLP